MKNIIIIVDMQKGFTRCKQTKDLSKRIISLLERNLFDAVVATRFINDDNSMYEKVFDWHMLKTETETALTDGLSEHTDYCVDKYTYNCVSPSFIQKLCQLNDGEYPEKVFIAGVDTDCCVMTIATALFEINIRPFVLTKYVASNGGEESHQAGLSVMKRLIGEGQLIDVDPYTKEDLEQS